MKKAFRKSLKRQSSLGGYLMSGLSSSASKPDNTHDTPIIWTALARKYQFNYPRDWYKIESHWLDQIESFQEQPIDCPGRDGQMNNAITRISQCNESYQLCDSLPRSFIVPKELKDVILIDTLSTIIKNHRVPVITYCCPIEYRRNFIIRCASASSVQHHDRMIEIIAKAVNPFEVFDFDILAPTLEMIDKAHKKLHNVCRRSDDGNDNQSNTNANFLSKSGKWLNKVSQTLKLANKTAHALLTQASVILVDDEDREWNCVISSLVQIIIEPYRRTIDGFESLISKEWIYLTGLYPNIDRHSHKAQHLSSQKPNILFDLFLDCTYQMHLQNPSEFEFSQEYLSYLFESHHNTRVIAAENASRTTNGSSRQNPHNIKASSKSLQQDSFSHSIYKSANHSNNEVHSLNVVEVFDNGKNSTLNPVYEPDKDSPIMKIYDHVANMKLWASQYIGSVGDVTNNTNVKNNHDEDNNNHT